MAKKKKNDIAIEGDAVRIRLVDKNGETIGFAVIDEADLEKVSKYHWCAYWNKDTQSYYAMSVQKRDGEYVNRKKEGGYRRIWLHRIVMDAPDGTVVDHMNHDTLDSRRSNLRVVSHTINNVNRRTNRRSTTGVKNVDWHKREGKFRVRLTVKGKLMEFGSFATLEEASQVAKEVRERYYPGVMRIEG